ncbi:hypothetical protein HRbin26_00954 [bacterium HR26]|nr:hypothetical protein HRbin26_00954 [bacterium HR26]
MRDPWVTNEIERRLASLRDRFPDRFSEAQWEEIHEDLEQLAQAAATLRRRALGNADEPDFIFVP